jgi:hypothetical protein
VGWSFGGDLVCSWALGTVGALSGQRASFCVFVGLGEGDGRSGVVVHFSHPFVGAS